MSQSASKLRGDLVDAFAAYLGCEFHELGDEWVDFIGAIVDLVETPTVLGGKHQLADLGVLGHLVLAATRLP